MALKPIFQPPKGWQVQPGQENGQVFHQVLANDDGKRSSEMAAGCSSSSSCSLFIPVIIKGEFVSCNPLCGFNPAGHTRLLLQSSIWSLQPPGHNDTLCLLYIRTSAATLSTGKTHLCSLHGSLLATFPSMNAYRMPVCLRLLCINLAGWPFQKSFCHFKSK